MILQRLGVRAYRAAFGVEDAHGIGNDVEDRFELRDVAAECFAELFSLADVVAGEEQTASARFFGERRERRLDQPASDAMLKGNSRRGDAGDPRNAPSM